MTGHQWDADLAKALGPLLEERLPPCKDAFEIREVTEKLLAQSTQKFHSSKIDAVQEDKFEVQSRDGTSITVHRFTPPNLTDPSPKNGKPAIMHCHGGGLIAGSVPLWSPILRDLSIRAGVTLYSPAYRRAPEHPFPLPLDDVYATLEWLSRNAAAQGVDPRRIGIMGDSAGGGLAAAAALRARDEGLAPPLAKQILICPMLDDRNGGVPEDHPRAPFLQLGWLGEYNRMGWDAYLGRGRGAVAAAEEGERGAGEEEEEEQVSPYAAPARAGSLARLPSTYIANGGLDLFVEEATEYGLRLLQAGVDVELHINPGLFHGYAFVAPSIPASVRSFENRIRAMNSF